jgi:hypothetical protein
VRTLLRILFSLVAVVFVAIVLVYAIGAALPVNHSVCVTGIIPAAPGKVFARITDVAAGARWRPAVKSVKVLPSEGGGDHWIEDLGHGQTMTFVATRTDAPTRREVLLDDANASYGGTWLYELSAGPSANSTTLRITETGFIHPPIYRFMMAHIFGPTYNLDQYIKNMQAAAPTL